MSDARETTYFCGVDWGGDETDLFIFADDGSFLGKHYVLGPFVITATRTLRPVDQVVSPGVASVRSIVRVLKEEAPRVPGQAQQSAETIARRRDPSGGG